MMNSETLSLDLFIKEIDQKKNDGFVVAKDGKVIYSDPENSNYIYTNYQTDDFVDFVNSFLDLEGEVGSYPLDTNSVVIVVGKPAHSYESCQLLEKMMLEVGIKPNDEIISSLVMFPYTKETPYSKTMEEVKKKLFTYDFTNWIQEKTKDFVGRQSIIDSIDKFIADNVRGYFVISAKPGMGKTSLAAYLVQQNDYIHHFNIRAEGINKPADFLKNICAQIISRYGMDGEYQTLPPEATQNSNFLSQILGKIYTSKLKPCNEKLIIVVDALDEVDNTGQSANVNTLHLPTTLPDNVYIITTMRQDSQTKLNMLCESENITIEPYSESNTSDISQYISLKTNNNKKIQQFISLQKIDIDYFTNYMIEKSEGNFIYLHYILSDIENGIYDDLGFKKIPKGLQQYYEQHWQIMRGKDESSWFEYKLPVLVALTVTKRPISVNLISKFSKVEQLSRITQVLTEWKQFLYEEDNTYNIQDKKYRLYHDNFHDFITSKDQVASERVDLAKTEKQIIDSLLPKDYGT